MKKHVASFDYLRVFACLLVLLCHWTQSVGHAEWAGCLSGGTGNTLFFALSGLLLGAASAGGGYKLDFFKKRFLRLYPAFFLLLVVHIGVLYGTGVRLPARSLILNFLGLSWFAHLPGTRHLWFVTGIAGLYALLFALSHMGARRWSVPLCCAGLLALQVLLKAVGISQGSYCSLLLAGVLGFACGPYVERISARTPRGLRIASLPVALAVYGLVCTALNGISPGHVPFYWAAFASAVLMVGGLRGPQRGQPAAPAAHCRLPRRHQLRDLSRPSSALHRSAVPRAAASADGALFPCFLRSDGRAVVRTPPGRPGDCPRHPGQRSRINGVRG